MISITSRHVVITPQLNSFIHERFKKLDRALKNYSLHIVITRLKDKVEVSCNLSYEGYIYHANTIATDAFTAIESASKNIIKQVLKSKSKHQEKLNLHIEQPIKLSKRKLIEPPILNLKEAIQMLNKNGYEFYIFRDEKTFRLNVCYKTDDGYGLIEIEEES
ncbi:MAG: ribosome-associated translation inhibitor RaiA [bacterium]|nr:ribosome-associated translation inhibitor RaiA [bacterium]